MVARFKSEFTRFVRDENGASLLEYTILLAIITVGAVASVTSVGTWVTTKWADLKKAVGAT